MLICLLHHFEFDISILQNYIKLPKFHGKIEISNSSKLEMDFLQRGKPFPLDMEFLLEGKTIETFRALSKVQYQQGRM